VSIHAYMHARMLLPCSKLFAGGYTQAYRTSFMQLEACMPTGTPVPSLLRPWPHAWPNACPLRMATDRTKNEQAALSKRRTRKKEHEEDEEEEDDDDEDDEGDEENEGSEEVFVR